MTTARSGVRNTPQTEKRNGVSTSLLDVSNNEGYGIDQAGNRMTGDGENPQADPQDAGTGTIAPATTEPKTSFAPSRFAAVVCGNPAEKQKYPYGGLCGHAEVRNMGINAETQYEPETHRAIVQITLEKHEMKETKDYTIGTSND